MAANRARRPGSDRGRAAVDWEAAFVFYASLPAESRSYAAVASRFGVSRRTVEARGRRHGWRQRVGEIEAEAARQADQQLGRARVAQLADAEKLIEASFLTYAQQLRNGDVQISAAGFATLVKLLQQLAGQPAEPTPETTPPPDTTVARTPERTQAVIEALRETGALEALGLRSTNAENDTNESGSEDA
jgi:hypothetical protein